MVIRKEMIVIEIERPFVESRGFLYTRYVEKRLQKQKQKYVDETLGVQYLD